MNTIRAREELGPNITRYIIEAPVIAAHRKPGQFVIIRVTDEGERIPLTIADVDVAAGTVSLIVQSVGKTTRQMALLKAGDAIHDIVGPLGKPTHIQHVGTVLCIGGGIGIAPLYPIAKGMKEAGNHVITVLGARTRDLLILEDDMRRFSDEMVIMTDDGSYGTRGVVTDAVRSLVYGGTHVDQAVIIGPPLMMKFTSLLTSELGVPAIASLNPIMVDGTGMCGACRVTVGGQLKFTCVDGPEFDAHQVDWDGLILRLGMYRAEEKAAAERFDHECQLHRALEEPQ